MVAPRSVVHDGGRAPGEVVRGGAIKRNAIKADVLFLVPWFLLMCAGVAVTTWDLLEQARETGTPPEISPLVLLFVVVGLTLAVVGAITLRMNYSSTLRIREGHELVVHGVYSIVRHPIYLGTLTVCLGFPIGTSSLLGFVTMLTLVPCFLYRIRIEERMMLEEFGDEYREYKGKTKRLIPFLY